MSTEPITVQTTVVTTPERAWHYYTEAEHVINWNFASKDWHCPAAINDLRVGGDFKITMAAKDGSMEFDLEGTYDEVTPYEHIAYTFINGRKVSVDFAPQDDLTAVKVTFDPEGEHPRELQQEGWQSILDNYRRYVARVEG